MTIKIETRAIAAAVAAAVSGNSADAALSGAAGTIAAAAPADATERKAYMAETMQAAWEAAGLKGEYANREARASAAATLEKIKAGGKPTKREAAILAVVRVYKAVAAKLTRDRVKAGTVKAKAKAKAKADAGQEPVAIKAGDAASLIETLQDAGWTRRQLDKLAQAIMAMTA